MRYILIKIFILRNKMILQYCDYLNKKNRKLMEECDQRSEKIKRYLEIVRNDLNR